MQDRGDTSAEAEAAEIMYRPAWRAHLLAIVRSLSVSINGACARATAGAPPGGGTAGPALVPCPELTLDVCVVVLRRLENGEFNDKFSALVLLGDVFDLMHRQAPLTLVQWGLAMAQQHTTQGMSYTRFLGALADIDCGRAPPVPILNPAPNEDVCRDGSGTTAEPLLDERVTTQLRDAMLYGKADPDFVRRCAWKAGLKLALSLGNTA